MVRFKENGREAFCTLKKDGMICSNGSPLSASALLGPRLTIEKDRKRDRTIMSVLAVSVFFILLYLLRAFRISARF
jgi:hypothetical protein